MSTISKPEVEPAQPAGGAFLSVADLRVRFSTFDGEVKAVDGLSFDLERGQTLGIVGESGSGKSVTNLAVLGLHDPRSTELEGRITLDGQDLTHASAKDLERIRGNKAAMIFQDPLTALSPFYPIGKQIAEVHRKHKGSTKREAWERAVEMLQRVGIPQPALRARSYPHQFSGGMRQRAMIAMALVCDPDLLIADEPTTALDVTVQAQILDLLKDLQEEFGSAIIFVTHDLGVIANTADDILVMYAGRCVERGSVQEVLHEAQHPYTWGLLQSIPRLTGDVDAELAPVRGTPPSLIDVPPGCPFHPRCDYVERVRDDLCRTERPQVLPETGHGSACHMALAKKQQIFHEEIQPRLGGTQ